MLSMNIKRYDSDMTNMFLKYDNNKIINCTFCRLCGQYTYTKSNVNFINILCLCDRRNQIFENYKNFINEIPDDFSGDELEDFMEEDEVENNVKKSMVKYIHRMVLFGMTYKENYYNNIDENITENILNFLG